MGQRVVCFGEVLLRLAPPDRERLLQSGRLTACVGGAEANVAVSLARFGDSAAIVGRVADNALGQAARAELRRHGVDVSALQSGPGRQGLYFLTPGAGQRPSQVLYDREASAFASEPPAAADWAGLLADAAWLHVSGVTPALGQRCADATLAAMRAARAAGVLVSFDGNFRPSLWARWAGDPQAILRGLFAEADLAFADARDIALVLGPGVEAEAANPAERFFAAAGRAFAAFPALQRMAATVRRADSADEHELGAVLAQRSGGQHQLAPRALTGIVDRIGAGDAFAAGVLHGILEGRADVDSLRFGLAAAILKHSIPGDFNLVDVAEVQALVDGGSSDVKR